jgi:hypothetical protein
VSGDDPLAFHWPCVGSSFGPGWLVADVVREADGQGLVSGERWPGVVPGLPWACKGKGDVMADEVERSVTRMEATTDPAWAADRIFELEGALRRFIDSESYWCARAGRAEAEVDRLQMIIGKLYIQRGKDASTLRTAIRRAFGESQEDRE